MRVLALGQAPRCGQVLGQVVRLLHRAENSLINRLLIRDLGFRKRLLRLGLALFEELSLGGCSLLLLRLDKVRVGELLVELESD